MKQIVIFSGTTEGRKLSELLSAQGIRHMVCVATDCGAEVMEENDTADIHVGRMDMGQMTQLIKNMGEPSKSLVIDATHPYAVEATANIKSAAGSLCCRYIRVVRERCKDLPEGAFVYDDLSACARHIDGTSGNILLTTGSKELTEYCGSVSDATKKRTYVRVLPTLESIELCRAQGIETDHIIAMQGPFGEGLNEAIIRQCDIKHLITKDSGAAGGMDDKVRAAKSTKAKIHVIARPSDEDGMSVTDVFSLITGKESGGKEICITLAGIGMGSESTMTAAFMEEVRGCDMLFGAGRLIENLSCPRKYALYRPGDIIQVLERESAGHVLIVFSGDSGFYSGAQAVINALKSWRSDVRLKVLPGISSISYLASKLEVSYEDAILYSLHGRNTEKNLSDLTGKVRHNKKVFSLVSDAGDVRKIAKRLIDACIDCRIFAGARLSGADESIRELTPENALSFDEEGCVTILIENRVPSKHLLVPVKKDSDFLRSDVPMTKECVRHESIIRLGLREGDIFYDIGGGTGSVAIEASSLDESLEVYTFEKEAGAADLIRQNIAKLGHTTSR